VRERPAPTTRPTVLVIGGGTMGDETGELYDASDVNVIAFDIYASPLTQFIADAHSIPIVTDSIDAVVIQAVLEHVLEPWKVVDEIHRILRDDGLVYADTPFLQPVHEGPYDFTRFTDSGHRGLFKRFTIIDSGLLAGSGTTLSWCFAEFIRALTRSTTLGAMARLGTFWMSRLDRVLDRRLSLDSASSVFFFGRKSQSTASPRELVEYYKGAQTAQK
jgi:SAM-dependent methyltransferase